MDPGLIALGLSVLAIIGSAFQALLSRRAMVAQAESQASKNEAESDRFIVDASRGIVELVEAQLGRMEVTVNRLNQEMADARQQLDRALAREHGLLTQVGMLRARVKVLENTIESAGLNLPPEENGRSPA